jgi:hypothetical protein
MLLHLKHSFAGTLIPCHPAYSNHAPARWAGSAKFFWARVADTWEKIVSLQCIDRRTEPKDEHKSPVQ